MNFPQYKKILRIGHEENKDIFSNPDDEIIVQEKIDGGNFRFTIINNNIIFGSRTQQLTSDEGEDTNVAKGFARCIAYVREKLKDKDLSKYSGVIFYGENCIKHTINYDWEKIPPFLGFDILDLNTNKFIHSRAVWVTYQDLGLPTVPLIKVCDAKDIIEITDDIVPISAYASPSSKDMKAEGVVFKNYDKQLMAKYVRDEFKERNTEAFGGHPKYNKEGVFDDTDMVFKYCTNHRIDKIVFKLVEEGNKLDMSMMGTLIKRTIQDIYEENWQEILMSNWKLDLKNVRNLVAKRCKNVLGQIITNNGLQ